MFTLTIFELLSFSSLLPRVSCCRAVFVVEWMGVGVGDLGQHTVLSRMKSGSIKERESDGGWRSPGFYTEDR